MAVNSRIEWIGAACAVALVGAAALFWTLRGPEQTAAVAGQTVAADAADTVRLEWSDLLPSGTVAFRPLDSASDFPEVASARTTLRPGDPLTGGDPETGASFTPAPEVDHNAARLDLDGKRVSIAGYMTPLGVEGGRTRTFLLVPYVGACVHVPAPPPNQIVLVESPEPVDVLAMWMPFRAVGELRVETIGTALAEVGYTMSLERIESYSDDDGKLEGVRRVDDD